MGRKLNLGAGRYWTKPGWESLDHSTPTLRLRSQAWDLRHPDETFEAVFCAHVIEHVSHLKIEEVLAEVNRVLQKGGILRLLTPDLRKLATAYVNNDREAMDLYVKEDNSGIRADLGLGQAFMNFILSSGYDNQMMSSDRSEIIAGYGHVFCYDFEMLSGLLSHYGFRDIRQCSVEDSAIEGHKDLRTCRHDQDKNHSLIVECRKSEYVPFTHGKALMHNGPYDTRSLIPSRRSPLALAFRGIGYLGNTTAFFRAVISGLLPRSVKDFLKKAWAALPRAG